MEGRNVEGFGGSENVRNVVVVMEVLVNGKCDGWKKGKCFVERRKWKCVGRRRGVVGLLMEERVRERKVSWVGMLEVLWEREGKCEKKWESEMWKREGLLEGRRMGCWKRLVG